MYTTTARAIEKPVARWIANTSPHKSVIENKFTKRSCFRFAARLKSFRQQRTDQGSVVFGTPESSDVSMQHTEKNNEQNECGFRSDLVNRPTGEIG